MNFLDSGPPVADRGFVFLVVKNISVNPDLMADHFFNERKINPWVNLSRVPGNLDNLVMLAQLIPWSVRNINMIIAGAFRCVVTLARFCPANFCRGNVSVHKNESRVRDLIRH